MFSQLNLSDCFVLQISNDFYDAFIMVLRSQLPLQLRRLHVLE